MMVTTRAFSPLERSVDVIDAKPLVGDEEHRDLRVRGGTMLHDLSLRKPYKGSRAERPFMGHEMAFENIQAVPARVRMMGIHHARGIANQTDLRPGFRVGMQVLAENHLSQFLVVTFFPGLFGRDDREEFVRHGSSKGWSSFSDRSFGRHPCILGVAASDSNRSLRRFEGRGGAGVNLSGKILSGRPDVRQ
jgi:hypothetical protein